MSKLEIIMDMMFFIQKKGGKAKPTHIMYGVNLSHGALKEYLDLLISNHFIEKVEEDGKDFYKITEKGLEHINELRKIKEFKDAFGIE